MSTTSGPVPLAGPDRSNVVADPSGGLGVHHGDDGRRGMGRQHLVWVERLSPRGLDGGHLRPQTPRHLAHALTEQSVHTHDHGIARVHEVDERRLHPRRPRAAQWQREGIRRAEHHPQTIHGLVEDLQEGRIEMAQYRPDQRSGDLGVGVRRPRSHQQSARDGHTASCQGARGLRQRAPRRCAAWRRSSRRRLDGGPRGAAVPARPRRHVVRPRGPSEAAMDR